MGEAQGAGKILLEGGIGGRILGTVSVDSEEGGDEGGPDYEGDGLGGEPGEAGGAVG